MYCIAYVAYENLKMNEQNCNSLTKNGSTRIETNLLSFVFHS